MLEARPPYIRFEVRSIEKRKPSAEGGDVFFIDEVFALITPHGSKDTTEKICSEWFPQLKEQVRQGRFSPTWYNAYLEAYQAFKTDQEPPLHGISIKNWPAASPAEIKILVALRVLTVEDLAAANDELAGRIGMGSRSLIARAKDYLSAKGGTGSFVAQMDALRQTVVGLENQIRNLSERNMTLEAQLAYKSNVIAQSQHDGLAPVEDRLAQAQLSAERAGPTDSELVDEAISSEIG
jgi:hypothetical protein